MKVNESILLKHTRQSATKNGKEFGALLFLLFFCNITLLYNVHCFVRYSTENDKHDHIYMRRFTYINDSLFTELNAFFGDSFWLQR